MTTRVLADRLLDLGVEGVAFLDCVAVEPEFHNPAPDSVSASALAARVVRE